MKASMRDTQIAWATQPRDAHWVERYLRWQQWLLFIFVLLAGSGAYVYFCRAFLDAYAHQNWAMFWGAYQWVYWVPLTTLLYGALLRTGEYKQRSLLGLREAAIAGDDAIAPTATRQPQPTQTDTDLPIYFSLPSINSRGRAVAGQALAFFMILLGLTPLAFLGAVIFSGGIPEGIAPLLSGDLSLLAAFTFLALVCCSVIALGAALVADQIRGARPLYILATENVLRWRGRGSFRRHTYSAAWDEALAFAVVAPHLPLEASVAQRRSFREDRVYLLETSQGALVWRESPWANEIERATSDRLASVIVARTGLPLRDLTEAWDTDDDTFHTLDTPAQVARRRRGRWLRWTLALLQIAALAGLALAAYALQHHLTIGLSYRTMW